MPALAAVLGVRCLVHATHAITEVRCIAGGTRAGTCLASLAQLAGRIAVTAVVGVALKRDATDAGAVVRLRRGHAKALARAAGALAAAAAPTGAAVFGVGCQRGAAVAAGVRRAERALALPALTDLTRGTRYPARPAILRIVSGHGHTPALTAVIDLAVALVVDAVSADLAAGEPTTSANIEFTRRVTETGPVVRGRASGIRSASAGADATAFVDSNA